MTNDTMKLTAEGDRLVKEWSLAQKRLERAKSELLSAECALVNTTNALGKWLMPPDAKQEEKFSVWYVDSLIQVEKLGNVTSNDYKVELRYRGREWSKIGL